MNVNIMVHISLVHSFVLTMHRGRNGIGMDMGRNVEDERVFKGYL